MDIMDWVKDALHVLNIWHRELITILRVPTPIKVTKVVTTLPDGCIGSGLDDSSDPETIWECSMAHEAWLHRITVTSLTHTPANPLTTGQIQLMGSSGQIIAWSPQPGLENNVLPVTMEREGRFSAAHLSPGEKLYAVGDQLPPNIQIRFDLQINLVSGISPDTPIPYVGTAITTPAHNGS